MKFLLDRGADLSSVTYNGTTNLISSCANEDADVNVVRLILKNIDRAEINQQIRPTTLTWNMIYLYAQTAPSQSLLMKSFAERLGRTALHYCARRGDVELVELLLSYGANPSIEDKMGKRVSDISTGFPELHGMLLKRERKRRLRGTQVGLKQHMSSSKRNGIAALGKRISTATPIDHEMWLISLENLLRLYGEGSHGHVMEVHQELKT